MSKGTRNYLNQWLIKSSNHIELTIFNMDRIYNAVTSKGEYLEIQTQIILCIQSLVDAKKKIPQLQTLFNDPRANKIEV